MFSLSHIGLYIICSNLYFFNLYPWILQCFEGKPLFEFDRIRMFRSGLVGFTLHGSLSHYYYQFCEVNIMFFFFLFLDFIFQLLGLPSELPLFFQELFPFQDWWVVPVKVIFDQTAWAAIWNSIYFTVLGFMRLESPVSIFNELKATFWPMLTVSEPSALTVSLHSCWAKSQCWLTSLCPFANGDWYSFCVNHKLLVYALAYVFGVNCSCPLSLIVWFLTN